MRRTDAQAYALLVAPAPAVIIGIVLMRSHGVSLVTIAIQGIALAIGGGFFMAARRADRSLAARAPLFILAALVMALASSFMAPGIDGVHRWIPLGPLKAHISSLLAPAALVAVAALLLEGRATIAITVAIAAQVLHVLQPDAASATAFAAGMLACVLGARFHAGPLPSARQTVAVALGLLILVAGAAIAWRMPDPLLPVPHVEGILEIAASRGPVFSCAAWASLVLAPALILWGSRDERSARAPRIAGAAIAAYLVFETLASRFGAFPVPLLGFGASPILGISISLGLVAAPWPTKSST